jgi:HAD superfamily hydrolase (TIGR01490 family)
MIESEAPRPRGSHPHYAAFVDVDDTLIRGNSLALFLGYCFELPLWPLVVTEHRRHEAAQIYRQRAAGASREQLCRQYYRLFRGVSQTQLRTAATRWYGTARARQNFFVERTRRELEGHRGEGASLVLVSGSFTELLGPLAAELGASVLATELEECAGVYTGEVSRLPIGEGKLQLVREYLDARSDTRREDCYAYGDHPSDVPFMEYVGHAVAVGDCVTLGRIAEQRGWRRIAWSSNKNVGVINEETNT